MCDLATLPTASDHLEDAEAAALRNWVVTAPTSRRLLERVLDVPRQWCMCARPALGRCDVAGDREADVDAGVWCPNAPSKAAALVIEPLCRAAVRAQSSSRGTLAEVATAADRANRAAAAGIHRVWLLICVISGAAGGGGTAEELARSIDEAVDGTPLAPRIGIGRLELVATALGGWLMATVGGGVRRWPGCVIQPTQLTTLIEQW